MAEPGDEFNFDEVFSNFPGVPGNLTMILMQAIISFSKSLRTVYEEHVRNGFSEEEAMRLTMSLQRDIVGILGTVGSAMAQIAATVAQKPKEEG